MPVTTFGNFRIYYRPIIAGKEINMSNSNPFEGIKIGDKVKVTRYNIGNKDNSYTTKIVGEVTDITGVVGKTLWVSFDQGCGSVGVDASRVKKIKVLEKAVPKVGDKIAGWSDYARLPEKSIVSKDDSYSALIKDSGKWRGSRDATGSFFYPSVRTVLRVGGELS